MGRQVGEWTKNKLEILAQYLPLYLRATTKAAERIYIDGFAGPGLNKVKMTGEVIDGSPLIALGARSANGTIFDRLFFIEKNHRAAKELEQTAEARDSRRRATVREGDVNVELPKLTQSLPKRSPTFVFLDTQGIEPKWTTVEAIAAWQTELLINFPFGMAINRNPGPKVTRYFGTEEWQRIWYSNRPGRLKEFLDLYKNRLRQLGYKYFMDPDPLITAPGGQRLYYLVFATKVKPGQDIMKWVQKQPDVHGQTRFWTEQD